MTATPLNDPADFPALYQAANTESLNSQKSFLRTFRVRLVALLVAAAGGAVAVPIWNIHLGAWVALAAFATALAAELVLAILKPDRIWYEGRAAAESAKTLTWRFCVGGENFEAELPSDTAEPRFLSELREILQDLRELDVNTPDHIAGQITDAMRAARNGSFLDRRELYKVGRIDNQRQWYSKKARWNAKRWRLWTVVTIVSEFVGLMLGVFIVAGAIEFDALGILAALAATVTAWVQAKQHQNLSTAYSITSQELASIYSEMDQASEAGWAKFVGQAEEAISREHTLWRASRGLRP